MALKDVIESNYKFALITPVRNEEEILPKTIPSVLNQIIKPSLWIFLNDGSTDRTSEIVKFYAKENPWIRIIDTPVKNNSTYKSVQEKLVLAMDKIRVSEYDFIGKLDSDIELPNNYFLLLIEKFVQNPSLGIAGGTLYHMNNGRRIIEENPKEHVRGGLKFYIQKCYLDIDGMDYKLGYDTIDEVKAAMKGWKTQSFSDILAYHHRPTGTQKGTIGRFHYSGMVSYLVGYHPIYIILKSIRNLFRFPFFIGSVSQLLGFFGCYIKRTERSITDPEFIIFLRKMNLKKIMQIFGFSQD